MNPIATLIEEPTHPTPTSWPPSRAVALTATAGAVTTAAFATGCVLTQAVTVPGWRAMEPAAFLTRFATSGPATGAVLFPIEIAATALLGATTYTTITQRRPGRLAWGAASAAMAATVVLLPAYFAGANVALLDPNFPPSAVPHELSTWNAWNWLRTTLGLAGTITSTQALTTMITDGDLVRSATAPRRPRRPARRT